MKFEGKFVESEGVRRFECLPTDLTKVKRPKSGMKEVRFSVSYDYNGGTFVNGEWVVGFHVPPPAIPEGTKLVGIGVGYQMNAKPPYATQVLVWI